MIARARPRPASGYAYRADDRVHDRTFRRAPDDAWAIVLLAPDRYPVAFHWLGRRWIDGVQCNVWRYVDPLEGGPVWIAQSIVGC